MNEVATTPSSDHPFKTRDNMPKLNKEKADMFHCVTTHILFATQRGRHDPMMAISFLTKRVGEDTTDKDNYKKMARVAKYIYRTKFLHLTIKATCLDQHHWFIDAAFTVHDDMRSHAGAYATFGKCMIDALEKEQQIWAIV
jgi:hypothetical protein